MMSFLSSNPLNDLKERFLNFEITGPVYVSLVVMGFVAILCLIIFIETLIQDPLKKPRRILALVEILVNWIEDFAEEKMGPNHGNWGGYLMGLFVYLFLSFIWSITGMTGVIEYLLIPFSLSVVMFVLIQVTAIHHKHLYYFHRYIEPVKIWLPINLITMWTPIISTSLRMFGNALAGSVVIGLVSWALRKISLSIFAALPNNAGQVFLAPAVIAVLNLYFSLFSGFIQTLVFASLNAVWIGQELPQEETMGKASQVTRQKDKELKNA
ncbi:MAG: FoF1 ATP synthase subunit a [Bacilli bacterium]|nr:FoF1 ATP synthase subunit a [Bacilli bacterium]MDY6430863.1 FoF1 ATP synthase subunit a [Bacilli bacterium]